MPTVVYIPAMTESEIVASQSSAPAAADTEDQIAGQLAAERVLIRSAAKGAAIGAAVCAVLWLGIVTLAVGGETGFGAMIWVGIVTGIVAGIFLGGCAGTLAGARHLEHYEHSLLRH